MQVLYSQFVALLDQGRVTTARLESGSSRIYFDVKPEEASASTEAPASSSSSPAVAKGRGVTMTQPLQVNNLAAAVAAGASGNGLMSSELGQSGATAAFKHKFQRQFFLKV